MNLHEQSQKPAPNAYPKLPKEKILGAYIEKAKNTYIDEMMYRAYATPSPYNFDPLMLKPKGFKGVSFNNVKSPRFNKLNKTADPGPGSYNTEEIINKLHNRFKGTKFLKSKNSGYIDTEVKRRNFVPSVGTYNNLERALSTAYRPMRKGRR